MRSSFAVLVTVLTFVFCASNAQAINLKKMADDALKVGDRALDKVGDIAEDGAGKVAGIGNGLIDKTNRKHGYPTTEELKQLLSEAKTVEERRAILLQINANAAAKRAADKKNKK